MEDKISKLERLVKICLVLLILNAAAIAANVALSCTCYSKLGHLDKQVQDVAGDASEASGAGAKVDELDTKFDAIAAEVTELKTAAEEAQQKLDETHDTGEEIADKLGLR